MTNVYGAVDSETKMVIIISSARGNMAHLQYQDAEKYLYKIYQAASIEVPFKSGLQPKQIVANDFITLECIDSDTVLLTAKKGYSWDGASGAINTESWIIASLIHDMFYQLFREGSLDRSLRKQADQAMYYFLKKSMIRGNYLSRQWGATRARASYLGVRAVGKKHTYPRKIKIKKVKIY